MRKQNKKTSFSILYKEVFKKWKRETGIKLTPNGVLVMKILIEYVNDKTQRAFPSVETIIDESELSKSAVFKKLELLEGIGLIKRHKRGGKQGFKRNEYEILLNIDEFTGESDNDEFKEVRPFVDDDIPF
jgi:Fe2+ or Zn2+ uptake regulation protein